MSNETKTDLLWCAVILVVIAAHVAYDWGRQ